jgi:hypothetical protein
MSQPRFDHGPDERVVVPVSRNAETNEGVPTQVANPSRASWRTFVQAIIPTLLAINVALPLIQQFLVDNGASLEHYLGASYPIVLAGVNACVIILGLASKLIAILMANPVVNEWISKYLPFLAPIRPAR